MRVAALELDRARSFLDREWAAVERTWANATTFERVELAFGAYESERLVGVAKGTVRGGVGHLSELVVAASERRRGIGKRLLDAWERACAERECHKVTLRTIAGDAAESLYLRGGWIVEATVRDDRGHVDWRLMAKWLAPK